MISRREFRCHWQGLGAVGRVTLSHRPGPAWPPPRARGTDFIHGLSSFPRRHRRVRRSRTLLRSGAAHARAQPTSRPSPPPGSSRCRPGRVVRVKKARLPRGERYLPQAGRREGDAPARDAGADRQGGSRRGGEALVHPEDKVCVKVNGIAQQNMATNKELVLPFVEAMIAAGVPAAEHHRPRAVPRLPRTARASRHERSRRRRASSGTRTTTRRWTGATSPARGGDTKFVRVAHRVDRAHQLLAHQGPLDLRLHGALKNMTHGCRRQPARLPPAPREPADRDALRAGRRSGARASGSASSTGSS